MQIFLNQIIVSRAGGKSKVAIQRDTVDPDSAFSWIWTPPGIVSQNWLCALESSV